MNRIARLARGLTRLVPALWLGLAATLAMAAPEPFDEARFKALQAEGALVLVDVHASWCPTCAKQQQVLDDYEAARPAVKLHRLLVDFDSAKPWVIHFKAPRQSTLILFRGEQQQWFSVAETRPEVIFEALDKAAAVKP
jgi:thiol-disulfide isomerase/thioredoxin